MSDAAMPPASDGSVGEPVAWAVAIGNEGLVLDGIFLRKRDADEAWAWRNEHTAYGARLIPLYAQSQPTLAAAEREAVKYFAAFDRSPRERDAAAAATLRALLARLSPPAT